MGSRLDRWLAPRLASREGDTLRAIDADPTTVTVRRDGAALPGAPTVRIVAGQRGGQVQRGGASQEATGDVTILATRGTDLRRGDILLAPGGVAYRVLWVYPGQDWRVEAAAEVVA